MGDSGPALKSLFVSSCFLKGGYASGCIMMATVCGQDMGFGHGHPSCAWMQSPSLKGEAVAKGSVDWTRPGPAHEPGLLCWDLFHHSGKCCRVSLPPTQGTRSPSTSRPRWGRCEFTFLGQLSVEVFESAVLSFIPSHFSSHVAALAVPEAELHFFNGLPFPASRPWVAERGL